MQRYQLVIDREELEMLIEFQEQVAFDDEIEGEQEEAARRRRRAKELMQLAETST